MDEVFEHFRGKGKKGGALWIWNVYPASCRVLLDSVNFIPKVYLNHWCHPSMENQTHNRLPGSFGTGSCHGFHNHHHQFHRRKEGCLTAWRKRTRTKNVRSQENTFYSNKPIMWWYTTHQPFLDMPKVTVNEIDSITTTHHYVSHNLQDVHDDTCCPAVHRPAVSLPGNHLRSCTRNHQHKFYKLSSHITLSHLPHAIINILTQVLWCPTGVFNESVLQFGKMKVTNDYFRVLQAVVVNQVLQLWKMTTYIHAWGFCCKQHTDHQTTRRQQC